MTAPLTPADCDLQHLPFMPLHVARLRDSDLAAEADPEACWYAVLLWAASWHQVPAASLPDNDAVLARLVGLGRDLKTWRKHRAEALRGFVLCEDGRLYHPVVAEQALQAFERSGEWEEREENRTTRQQRWRERCKALSKQLREAGVTPPPGASLKTLEEMVSRLPAVDDQSASPSTEMSTKPSTVDASEMPKTGTRTGTSSSDPDGSAQSATSDDEDLDPLAEIRELPIAKACWRLAVKVLVEQGRLNDPKARTFVGKLKAQGLTDDELWEIAEAAWREQTEAPQPYLLKAAENAIQRRSERSLAAPPEFQQRAWMRDFVEGVFEWKEHERGPKPGEPGCRVAPAIQREFGVEPARSAA